MAAGPVVTVAAVQVLTLLLIVVLYLYSLVVVVCLVGYMATVWRVKLGD